MTRSKVESANSQGQNLAGLLELPGYFPFAG